MEEKKNTMEQLDIEELSDVNGGYENAVSSGSYAAAKESAGVQVAAMSEADAIRQNVPVIGLKQTMENILAGHKPQHNSGGESYGNWADDL